MKSRRPHNIEKTMKNLKPFKKGQSGNPEGGRAHDPVKRELKKITLETIKQMVEDLATKSPAELEAIYQDKNQPIFEAWFAKIAATGINDNDMGRMRFLLEYSAGKVPDKTDNTHRGGPAITITMPSNGRDAKKE